MRESESLQQLAGCHALPCLVHRAAACKNLESAPGHAFLTACGLVNTGGPLYRILDAYALLPAQLTAFYADCIAWYGKQLAQKADQFGIGFAVHWRGLQTDFQALTMLACQLAASGPWLDMTVQNQVGAVKSGIAAHCLHERADDGGHACHHRQVGNHELVQQIERQKGKNR